MHVYTSLVANSCTTKQSVWQVRKIITLAMYIKINTPSEKWLRIYRACNESLLTLVDNFYIVRNTDFVIQIIFSGHKNPHKNCENFTSCGGYSSLPNSFKIVIKWNITVVCCYNCTLQMHLSLYLLRELGICLIYTYLAAHVTSLFLSALVFITLVRAGPDLEIQQLSCTHWHIGQAYQF